MNPIYLKDVWTLNTLSDADYAADQDTCISVYGFVPIAWKSKGMKSVMLSMTEAECIAVSELVKELQFVIQFLGTMDIEVQLPI